MSFIEMSLMGGAVIACALLARKLARGRLPAAFLPAMWTAALLRLVLPVAIPSPVSILGLLKHGSPSATAHAAQSSMMPAEVSPLVYVWLLGAALCALGFGMAGARQRRVLRQALPAPMSRELKAALADQRLKRPVDVYTSDRVATPLTYGILRPRIILPGLETTGGKELRYVIAHECAHIRRGDAAKKLVFLAAVCLHWFNPLVWLMAITCSQDMELSCDRQVLRDCGKEDRAAYARTLVRMEERKRFSGILLECFSQSPLEERIVAAMDTRKATRAGTLVAAASFLLMAIVFLTAPGAKASRTDTVWVSMRPLASYDSFFNDQVAAVYVWKEGGDNVGQAISISRVPSVTPQSVGSYEAVQATPYGGRLVDVSTSGTVIRLESGLLPMYTVSYTVKSGGDNLGDETGD